MLMRWLAVLVFGASSGALAQRCVTTQLESEGCGNLLDPTIAAHHETFRSQCIEHDHCAAQLGANESECDARFLSSLLHTCDARWDRDTPTWVHCRAAAERLSVGVRWFGQHPSTRTFGALQVTALEAVRSTARAVLGGECGTTPEASRLFSHGFMQHLRAQFRATRGRLPTTYEFFELTLGSLSDQAIAAYAGSRPATGLEAPTIGISTTETHVQLWVAPPRAEVTYAWKLGTPGSTEWFTSVPLRHPETDSRWEIDGYVVARNAEGSRELTLVRRLVFEGGTPRDTGPLAARAINR